MEETVNKLIQKKKKITKTKIEKKKAQTVKMIENEEVVVYNSEESDEDSRRMITRTARFSMNKEAAVIKKIKACNEEHH